MPSSVWDIPVDLFLDNNTLNKVIVPEDISKIGSGAFMDSSLTEIDLPITLIQIGNCAFAGTKLKTVKLPQNVSRIGEKAFYGCDELESIYIHDPTCDIFDSPYTISETAAIYGYTNSTAQAYAEQYGRRFYIIGEGPEPANQKYIIGYFSSFADSAMEEVQKKSGVRVPEEYNRYPFKYSDSFFEKPATEYNHELATMSLCLAMSAFNGAGDDTVPLDNPNKDRYIRDLLKKCDFDNETIVDYGYDDSLGYDTMAACFGQKVIGDDVVIAIGIRGGNYKTEWVGNFNVGEEGNHEGFEMAKSRVLMYFNQYLRDHFVGTPNENKNIKLWISGYSRGAATANLTAAALNDIHEENRNDGPI